MTELEFKEENLKNYLKKLNKVAVCFSAGVDSSLLLKEAFDTLGNDNVIAITVKSDVVPSRDIEEGKDFCKKYNINQTVIPFNIFSVECFKNNPKDRCYHCKKAIFSLIKEEAKKLGFENVIEGSNMDDMSDYRPGLKAIQELGILSPLKEAELYKDEIRILSKELDLETYDKPSFACLASRFVYGEEITLEKLTMVEKAEDFLKLIGIKQFRVRFHGKNLARIEVEEEDILRIAQKEIREAITDKFKELGFKYISLDLNGFKSGNMN